MSERPQIIDYAGACYRATVAQGLAPFHRRPGWEVEQTGGFTMVAVLTREDGSGLTVVAGGEEYADDLYSGAEHPKITDWWEHEMEGCEYREMLTLDQVLDWAERKSAS